MQKSLNGRLAIVTGASSGIGHATALAFARAGAEVLATARRESRLADLAAEAGRTQTKLRCLAGDLRDRAFVRKLAAEGAAADILVSSAGSLVYAPLIELSADECAAMFDLNVLATLSLCQEVGRYMLARGAGHMIVITSGAARQVFPFGSVYAATKHALAALTQAMRLEWEPRGVRVTEIAPGTVATEMRNTITHPAALASIAARKTQPIEAADVAEAALYAATAPDNAPVSLLEVGPRLR